MPEQPPTGGRSACRDFLRGLEMHTRDYLAGRQPDHAGRCSTCAAKLRRIARCVEVIATRPPIPAGLRRREVLDEVYGSVVESVEAGPLGQPIRDALAAVPAPSDCPWPLQEISAQSQVLEDLAVPVPAGEQAGLWSRTLADVRTIVAEQKLATTRHRFGSWSTRRATVAAAAAVLITLGAWNLVQSEGTQADPEIVFVRVDEVPAAVASHLPLPGLGIR